MRCSAVLPAHTCGVIWIIVLRFKGDFLRLCVAALIVASGFKQSRPDTAGVIL